MYIPNTYPPINTLEVRDRLQRFLDINKVTCFFQPTLSNAIGEAIIVLDYINPTNKGSHPIHSSPKTWIDNVWSGLQMAREDLIPEGDPDYDETWSDLCTAMAWITEALIPNENLFTVIMSYNNVSTDASAIARYVVTAPNEDTAFAIAQKKLADELHAACNDYTPNQYKAGFFATGHVMAGDVPTIHEIY